MTELKCEKCGGELLPGTGFCRRCGAAVNPGVVDLSEQTTAILGRGAQTATQRLDSRPTTPTRTSAVHAEKVISSGVDLGRGRRVAFIVFALVAIAILAAIAVTRLRGHDVTNDVVDSAALLYPGAQTVVDMTNQDGSRTVHLQTTDKLDQVESWYQKSLKFAKTIRLTSTSVVMKNEKVTVTLAEEDNKTNILIKQLP